MFNRVKMFMGGNPAEELPMYDPKPVVNEEKAAAIDASV